MTPSSTRWLRRLLLALCVVPVLVVLVMTGLWLVATNRIEAGVQEWMAQARGQGWTVEAGPPQRTGWPLSAAVDYHGLAVSGAGAGSPLPITWHADLLRVSIALLHPRLLTVAADGPESLRFGAGPTVPFTGDVVALVMPLAGAGPAAVRAVNLRVGAPDGAGSAPLTVASLLLHGGAEGGGFRFDLDAVTIGLPQSYPWLFGPRIASLAGGGLLHGPLPGPASAVTTSPAQAATEWRNGGGTLEFRNIALDWGPLRGGASGTLGLDGDLQPMGAGTFRVEDYPKVLETLTQAGRITRQAAMAATAVLALVGHASDQNGKQMVELPLKLQDRTLQLGRIPLARMPEMVWPSQ